MGCDIHTVTEVKTPNGWEAALLDDPIFDWRSYRMFGFLADVRNYSDVPCLWGYRGWPEDISGEAESLRERWGCDGHSYTHVTLAELLAFNYDQSVEDRRVTKQTGPNSWDGGATAEPGDGKMTTYREFLDPDFFNQLSILHKLGKPEDVRVLMLFDN